MIIFAEPQSKHGARSYSKSFRIYHALLLLVAGMVWTSGCQRPISNKDQAEIFIEEVITAQEDYEKEVIARMRTLDPQAAEWMERSSIFPHANSLTREILLHQVRQNVESLPWDKGIYHWSLPQYDDNQLAAMAAANSRLRQALQSWEERREALKTALTSEEQQQLFAVQKKYRQQFSDLSWKLHNRMMAIQERVVQWRQAQ